MSTKAARPASLASGALGSLLCAGGAWLFPALRLMFAETGLWAPPPLALLLPLPAWGWWLLCLVSPPLLGLKDRWLAPADRECLNTLFVALALGAAALTLLCLHLAIFAPLPDRL